MKIKKNIHNNNNITSLNKKKKIDSKGLFKGEKDFYHNCNKYSNIFFLFPKSLLYVIDFYDKTICKYYHGLI